MTGHPEAVGFSEKSLKFRDPDFGYQGLSFNNVSTSLRMVSSPAAP